MSSACVLWFPWPHLRSGVRQINQLDGIEYVAARERVLGTPECRDGQHGSRDRDGVFGRGGSLNVKLDLIGLNSFCFSLQHWELLSYSLCSPDQRDAGYSGASRLRSSLVSSNQMQTTHAFAYRGALRTN